MEYISLLFQVVVAVSVLIVWVFRYHNVITEFQQFGYSDVFRNFVGASKIATSTLLLTGICYEELRLMQRYLWLFLCLLRSFLTFGLKTH